MAHVAAPIPRATICPRFNNGAAMKTNAKGETSRAWVASILTQTTECGIHRNDIAIAEFPDTDPDRVVVSVRGVPRWEWQAKSGESRQDNP
jgi:hypothetical protein